MSTRRPVVAIDGPAGAGKSTVAKQVAQTLGFSLVDTGALYRAVALAAKERQLSVTDHARIGALAAELVTTGALRLDVTEAQAPTVILDGTARTTQLRSPDISQAASVVSAIAEVRAALLAVQRDAGAQGGVVLEGRDIGTVVFPHADVKVFLTADDHERARRRLAQLGSSGVLSDMDTVLREVRERDQRDAERDVAPMRPADDAVTLDCSALSAQQVIDRIVALVRAVQNG